MNKAVYSCSFLNKQYTECANCYKKDTDAMLASGLDEEVNNVFCLAKANTHLVVYSKVRNKEYKTTNPKVQHREPQC